MARDKQHPQGPSDNPTGYNLPLLVRFVKWGAGAGDASNKMGQVAKLVTPGQGSASSSTSLPKYSQNKSKGPSPSINPAAPLNLYKQNDSNGPTFYNPPRDGMSSGSIHPLDDSESLYSKTRYASNRYIYPEDDSKGLYSNEDDTKGLYSNEDDSKGLYSKSRVASSESAYSQNENKGLYSKKKSPWPGISDCPFGGL